MLVYSWRWQVGSAGGSTTKYCNKYKWGHANSKGWRGDPRCITTINHRDIPRCTIQHYTTTNVDCFKWNQIYHCWLSIQMVILLMMIAVAARLLLRCWDYKMYVIEHGGERGRWRGVAVEGFGGRRQGAISRLSVNNKNTQQSTSKVTNNQHNEEHVYHSCYGRGRGENISTTHMNEQLCEERQKTYKFVCVGLTEGTWNWKKDLSISLVTNTSCLGRCRWQWTGTANKRHRVVCVHLVPENYFVYCSMHCIPILLFLEI